MPGNEWFIGMEFSKFHDFSMTFDDFSKFHDFPWLFQKILFFQVFQTLWEPWEDTGHFIFLLEKIGAFPGPTLLATFDVTSLYTNVPLEEAWRAVGRSLLRSRHSGDVPHTESLLHLLKLVFTKNIFSFSNGENFSFYLQTNGISMGSKCAPAVACIFMEQFEETFVYSLQTSKRPLTSLRYIDDIFCLWPHGPEKLASFTEYLNSCHPKIKFTCDSSPHCIDFLDVRVHLTEGRLTTELFTKPTSSLAYLLRSSYHPRRVFDALPYGEFVRTRRNCATIEKFDSHSNRLLQAFLERGYNLDQLEKARSKARQLSRQDILDKYALPVTPQITPSSPPDQFYLTVKFFQSSHLVRDLIKHNWTVLGKSETTTSLYENKLVISYKCNPRLRDMLVKSSIPKVKNYGKSGKSSNSCNDPNCKYCPYIDVSGNIFSTTTKKRHNAKINVCCNSSNLIYCLTCNTCEKQYVGMTKRKLRQRLYEHLRNIRQGNVNDPIGRHFSKSATQPRPFQGQGTCPLFYHSPAGLTDCPKHATPFWAGLDPPSPNDLAPRPQRHGLTLLRNPCFSRPQNISLALAKLSNRGDLTCPAH